MVFYLLHRIRSACLGANSTPALPSPLLLGLSGPGPMGEYYQIPIHRACCIPRLYSVPGRIEYCPSEAPYITTLRYEDNTMFELLYGPVRFGRLGLDVGIL